eukprot:1746252-Amphidinium_carterae.1
MGRKAGGNSASFRWPYRHTRAHFQARNRGNLRTNFEKGSRNKRFIRTMAGEGTTFQIPTIQTE